MNLSYLFVGYCKELFKQLSAACLVVIVIVIVIAIAIDSALVVWLLGLRLLHEANDVWAQASDQVEQSNKNSEPKIEENKNGEKKHCHVKFMSFN